MVDIRGEGQGMVDVRGEGQGMVDIRGEGQGTEVHRTDATVTLDEGDESSPDTR